MEAELQQHQPNADPRVHVKEIKLQLPLRTHVSLHSFKLLKNQSIRDSVVAALDRYFEAHPLDPIGVPVLMDADAV